MKPSFPTYYKYTISRDDIVDFSRRLALCIPQDFLRDPKNPVVVSVNGSWGSGKKIISDFAVEALFGFEPDPEEFKPGWTPENKDEYREYSKKRHDLGYVFNGALGVDEHMSGIAPCGERVEVLFADLYHGLNSFSGFQKGDRLTGVLLRLLEERQKRGLGGISYIQNSCHLVDGDEGTGGSEAVCLLSDIDVSIENADEQHRCTDLTGHLNALFGDAAKDSQWGRYIEVQVTNPKLFKDAQFHEVLQGMGFSLLPS
jgi:hypothetical protein